MAVAARLVRVRTDRSNVTTLRLVVAAHAVRGANREIRSEAVAILARGQLRSAHRVHAMQRRWHLAVAAPAQIRGWAREARVAVTIPARDVGALDMGAMASALADRPPDRGNVLGDARRSRVATCGSNQDEYQDADHRVVPMG